ncbi:MAG: DUF6427 family protein [Prevotellaceae bacterium]|jgi:hypothetical protein|nr:DUF6427 family protein [Prevotellaceae bacterium]
MPADLLKRNTFVASGFYFTVLLALWLPQLLLSSEPPAGFDSPAIAPAPAWISRLFEPAVSTWLAFVLTFVAAMLLSFLNYRHAFCSSDNYRLPLLYILTAAAIPSTHWLSGAQPATISVLIGLNYLFHSYQKSSDLRDVFIAAFCFSLSAICFPPALLLLLLLPAAILLLRPVAWRDWVVLLVGETLPFAYLALFYWLSLNDVAEPIKALWPAFPIEAPAFDRPVLIFWGVVAGITVLSAGYGIPLKVGSLTKTLYGRRIFIWMLLLLAAGFVLYPAYGYDLMLLCALPVAVITAGYLAHSRHKRFKQLCWLLWLAAMVYLQWHTVHIA